MLPDSEAPLWISKAIEPPSCTSWLPTSEMLGHQVKTLKDFLQSELQKFSYSLWRDFIYCQAIETNVSVVFCTKLNAEKLKYKNYSLVSVQR